jgi:translation initiation factor 1
MLASAMSVKPPGKPPEKLPSNPFAKLETLRDQLPSREIVGTQSNSAAAKISKGPARAVIRYEKKGRGGKMVTAIEKLGLTAVDLERWCSELKRELGCGGSVEDDAIVLQGDLRSRLHATLTRRGVGNIVGTDLHK